MRRWWIECVVAAGLAGSAITPASAKDTLTVGVAQFPASLHPYISAQTVQWFTIGFAQRPITAFLPDGKPHCLLCTEVPTLENGLARIEDQPDGSKGLAVTIKLLPGLKWNDGVPVTAKDILFTWTLGRDPAAGFTNNYPWSRATKVDVVDDQTAVLHLPRTLVTYQMWDHILPEHIEAPVRAAGSTPLDYINATKFNAAPTTPGLWNGPYQVSGYQSGDRVVLTPNPYWPGKKPAFKQVVVRLLENTAALQANLLSGDVDVSIGGIGVTTDQAVAMQKSYPGQFQFFYRPGLSLERIDMQTANPAFADLRVRQALILSIDRKTLIDRLFGGHAKLAATWINDLEPNYSTDVATYGFDPARARALLKESGWTPGPDGICRNAAGERLAFEFSTTSGNRVRELSQQVMQSQWKAVGVEVTIKNEPSRSFFGETMRKRSFPGLVEYANMTRVGLPPANFFSSKAIPTAANNYNGLNWSGFADPAFDTAMAAAETELDPAKQKALWLQMQQIYADKLVELPLYFREDPDIVPAWLKGYLSNGKEDYQSYTAEDWTD